MQQIVRLGLVGRFLWCMIRQEQAVKLGRTDIEIVDDRTEPPGTIYHHALLELKILRSFGSTGTPVTQEVLERHILDGVNQAHSYGDTHNSLLRMLCCFDMRKADIGDSVTFAHVSNLAKDLNVSLRRWYLYHSSKALREANADAKVSTVGGAP
ncbi:conserved hypothetical protein [Acidithiobacillus ferrooxidans ATCC 53993]|uniref:Uncharacterized protein n=1 Tax=Acidithiobacillus ferrooxidans TaxID=920 RepID=A0A2W1KDX6_ACIFR|nr:hypothetical protein [Acidithiobacillus ferrooxidans]ACH84332.1 conserved hypothetical protein [Acidithiobacillus ferrooxidans ATCC 53993]EGQ61508.1 hypothetical protein GGI1_07087 [Acidithiobacillus sp. GGI-221]MBU2720447.1 hypothetical protein [Acidithiobacillus ferridurans]MBU2819425.1 hypothetical protein [Acidithiobacillus ferrooxidans]MBU2825481.1 hypothetical protein [Acidithiobacillus ferrooxidans]